tara:strand:+ start:330 stop:563 length:234 start_codon:yes stop_codon:yes gene_type:complete
MIKEGAVVKFKITLKDIYTGEPCDNYGEIIEGVVTGLWSITTDKIVYEDRVKIECKSGPGKGTWVIPKKEITEVLHK